MNSNKSDLSSDIDFSTWMETLEKEAKAGCLREIARHKAALRNIYYSNHGVPTFEILCLMIVSRMSKVWVGVEMWDNNLKDTKLPGARLGHLLKETGFLPGTEFI